jgi:hypothetical protein
MNRGKSSLLRDISVVCLATLLVSGVAFAGSLLSAPVELPEARTVSVPDERLQVQSSAYFFS